MPSKNYPVTVKGNAVANLFLRIADDVSINVKLYRSTDKEKSELHKGCPECLSRVFMPNYCSNDACANNKVAIGEKETTRIFIDEEGFPVEIPTEAMEALLLPPSEEFPDGQPLPDTSDIIIHTVLNEKKAYSMLTCSTEKYYVVPGSQFASEGYMKLLATMLAKREALMVKFCLKSQKQNLGLLVEDQGQIVLCVIPYESAFRPLPKFSMPDGLTKDDLAAFNKKFSALPRREYGEAVDSYSEAFNKMLKDRIAAAAAKREAANPKPKVKPADLVKPVLSRAERDARPPKASKAGTGKNREDRLISLAPASETTQAKPKKGRKDDEVLS